MKLLNWLLVVIGIFGLIGVRMLEEEIFYDPFLTFFKVADKHANFPVFSESVFFCRGDSFYF